VGNEDVVVAGGGGSSSSRMGLDWAEWMRGRVRLSHQVRLGS
jgi:hypothetical protein